MNVFIKDKFGFSEKSAVQDSQERPGKYSIISQSPLGPIIIMALSIFGLEAIVMMLLSSFPPFHSWREALLDSTLLVVLLSPTLYFFLFRPLTQHIAQRKRAEEKLRQAHDQLERRVHKRTAELAKANEELKVEIKERKRAEEALQRAHDNLERKVEERNRELIQSNKELIREIEERKQTEEELLQAKAMLQTVFDGISDPLVMLDNTLSIRMLNEAAQKFYQVTDHENVIGKSCYEAIKGRSEPCEGCEVPRAILNGKRRRFERKGFMDPNRLEDVVVYPTKKESGEATGAILHIRDITDRKLFEKQIIQSEKLASLGVLVSSIAHEINNPNSFIMFNIPILREYLEGLIPIVDSYAEGHPDLDLFHMPYPEFRKDVFRLLNNVEHGSARINSVVANLREFSRGKDKREEKWIDLKSVIERALAMCEVKMTKTVRSFAKDIPEDLPHVYSDPYALEQILINLLLNAAQASDKKDSRVDLSVAVNDSWLDHTVIRVSDNGYGMDDKTKQHIFDPFFTSKLRADGTGLGLYVTHNLVEGLRGRVEVESEFGEGSVFRIVLPDKERRKKKRD